jgi:hypothetical protein
VNYENSHKDALEIQAPNTSTWILDDEEFQKWYQSKPSMEAKVLLCVGPTGSGKTILT